MILYITKAHSIMNTEGITLPIDLSNKIWIQNKDDLIIGHKYIVFKEWSRSTYNPTERLFHMFIAKLYKIEHGNTMIMSQDDPTQNINATIHHFTNFEFYYGNNSAYSHIQRVIPTYASYASYSRDVNELELYSCYFFLDYQKPLPNNVMEAIELYPFHKTKDEIGKKTGLPNDILNFMIPEYISKKCDIKT